MQLVLNDNQIIAYATKGTIVGAVDYTGTIPDDFELKFKPLFYLLKADEIVTNPEYTTPVTPNAGPTPEQQALTAMAQQMADQQQHIASIEQALTALAQGGAKS